MKDKDIRDLFILVAIIFGLYFGGLYWAHEVKGIEIKKLGSLGVSFGLLNCIISALGFMAVIVKFTEERTRREEDVTEIGKAGKLAAMQHRIDMNRMSETDYKHAVEKCDDNMFRLNNNMRSNLKEIREIMRLSEDNKNPLHERQKEEIEIENKALQKAFSRQIVTRDAADKALDILAVATADLQKAFADEIAKKCNDKVATMTFNFDKDGKVSINEK